MREGIARGVSQQPVRRRAIHGDVVQVVARQENIPAALVLEKVSYFAPQA